MHTPQSHMHRIPSKVKVSLLNLFYQDIEMYMLLIFGKVIPSKG